jgi:LysM repeat protein
MSEKTFKYTIASGDTLWGLANEYTKINKKLTNAQAQQVIKELNPNLKSLKVGETINLPFEKKSTATAAPKTPYEKWQATIKAAITDASWDKYDKVIKSTVLKYNSQLGKKSRLILKAMPTIKWTWIKAMVWVESGGPNNPAWNKRPMQIGNPGDPGYSALKREEGAAKIVIVVDDRLRTDISNVNTPTVNIRIGIAYLISRLAKIEPRSILNDKDKKEYEYSVVAGDSFDRIAKKVSTTVEELQESNPNIKPTLLKPKMKLKYHKASKEIVIVDWRPVTAATLYERYNQGDPLYAKKLTYVMNEVFPKLKRKTGVTP